MELNFKRKKYFLGVTIDRTAKRSTQIKICAQLPVPFKMNISIFKTFFSSTDRTQNQFQAEVKVSRVKSSLGWRSKSHMSKAVLGRGQSLTCQKQCRAWSDSHLSKAVSAAKSKSHVSKGQRSKSQVSKAVLGRGQNLTC